MQDKIIEMLRADMRGEHQAIIQYLFHAYAMGEGELACEIEAIAREEMRHLDWLADAIIELGGDPSMDRDPVDFAMDLVSAQMAKDVILEERAIAQYRAHMEAIEDEKIRRLLARIVHDEESHHGDFEHFVEKTAAEEQATEGAEAPAPSPMAQRLAEILNQGIHHEYSVLLQYIFHSFVAPDKERAEELQNIGINEMQHMGWLAEEMMGMGGMPIFEHGDLVLTHDMEEALEADIEVEREVTNTYSRQIPEIDDPGIKSLIERIRDHEIYHDAVFTDLLEETREQEPEKKPEDKKTSTPPSVGSLKK